MSFRYKVYYTAEAKADLKAIYYYIGFELMALKSAERQVNDIRRSVRGLEMMPLRYPLVENLPNISLPLRKMTVDRYLVFYTVDGAAALVKIIRIFYGGRNVEELFFRDVLS